MASFPDASEWEEGNHAAQAGLTNAMFDWLEDSSRSAGTNLKLSLHQWNVVLGLYASSLLRRLIEIAGKLIDRQAEVIIIGCTDISLAVNDGDLSVPMVDSLQVLTEKTVSMASK